MKNALLTRRLCGAPASIADTIEYRASLSHHFAPRRSKCWQNAFSAAWLSRRFSGGSRGLRPRNSKSMASAESRTITPPRDGHA